jgi:predicted DNA-binding protein (MmcQ/YjbR family)
LNEEIITNLQERTEQLQNVVTRSMFGYQCYSVRGKFFVGFSKKDKDKIIIRLSSVLQKRALLSVEPKMKPFIHGARMGWVEVVSTGTAVDKTFNWIRKGYAHAKKLSESK